MPIDNEFSALGEKRLRENRRRASVVPAPNMGNPVSPSYNLNMRPDIDEPDPPAAVLGVRG
jgi:hypothetical protein